MIEPRPRPGLTGRPRALLILFTVCFVVLGLRLWSLQVVQAGHYREVGLRNRGRDVIVRPERGRILDCRGRPLADNRARLDACVDYSELGTRAQRDRVIEVLRDILGLPEDQIRDALDPRNVIAYVPVLIQRDISFDDYLKLKVLEPLTPGLMPMSNSARRHRYGELAAQTVGYTGLVPDQATLERLQAERPALKYDGLDVIGLAGLELEFEPELQGRKGETTIEVDNRGRRRRVLNDKDQPVPGSDVVLTLDIELQRLAQELLGTSRGAFVAMDPRNGDVLVMASTPSFDPNVFTIPRRAQAVDEIRRLNSDPARPLWNRCIQDQYPLGSAFKAVVALAALNLPDEARRITAQTTFYCSGTFRLTRGSRWSWDCYHQHAHGEMNVVQAIKKSCNVFFYNVGQRIGPDAIVELADRFGLGHLTGVALPDEHAGVNPTREWQASGDWRAEPYRHWYPGHTVNLSIGQSPLEVTPLQVAQLYSAVAMDGVEFKPRLVTKIVGPDGAEESFAPQSRRIELSAESLALVKEGLREVTREGGTAAEAFKDLQELNVAGKTSTAEVGEGDNKKNHAWFIAFAPADAPQIVVVVLVEEGETGGHTAAPLAAEFLKAYFARK